MTESAYTDADRQRWIPEAPKSPGRTDFERDRARVLHSSALRRLGEKTQVLGPATDDFVRTRLTHSLEVAQVGRQLGKLLGADPDVVDAACLSHDLGHPPFGHNGEKALDELAADAGGFEGNAQTLRVLTRLEPKVLTDSGQFAGLNLTRATLDAVCKYPWARGQGQDRVKSQHKYSVYSDDVAVFEWVREGVEPGRRCLEAQIMDLSDDIAYSVHDVEDAIATGKMNPAVLRDDAELNKVFQTLRSWYAPQCSDVDLAEAVQRLASQPWWMTSFDHSWASLAALKDTSSQLIGRFCVKTVDQTRATYGQGALGRYRADLVIPQEVQTEILVLKGLAAHYVMEPRETEPVYFQQRTLLADLVDALWAAGVEELEPIFQEFWRAASSEEERLRVIIDQVASLTDSSASQWHARLCGMLSTQL